MTASPVKYLCATVLVASLVVGGGCVPKQSDPGPMPTVTPPPDLPETQGENPGSLFDPGQNEVLFADNRARQVGDLVTVNIVDTTSGTHEAETTADRSTSVNLGVQNYFGKGNVRALPFGLPSYGMNGAPGTTPLVEAGSTSSHNATGETERDSELTATIGCRIIRALPGGVMEIEGARYMRINDETQILVVKGTIRKQDITSNNTITSDRLANARIEYYGEGILADKQKPGWLARVLDNVWPF